MHPEMEAIAGEVALLRSHFRRSVSWGITTQRRLQFSWRRGFGFSPVFYKPFRAATYLLQRMFQINHLFGGLGDWFHLQSLNTGSTVMTLATSSEVADCSLLRKVDHFAVEWPGAVDLLNSYGVSNDRITVILPPVDVERFNITEEPDAPFTVLFASSPDRADWFEGRGIYLLLEAARQLPDVKFRLLWRPWGDGVNVIKKMLAGAEYSNVELVIGRFADMSWEYQNVHATIAPFVDPQKCKPIPNTLLESLACGRPVVMTRQVELGKVLGQSESVVVCDPEVQSVVPAIKQLQTDWKQRSTEARSLAERTFDARRFIRQYDELYQSVV